MSKISLHIKNETTRSRDCEATRHLEVPHTRNLAASKSHAHLFCCLILNSYLIIKHTVLCKKIICKLHKIAISANLPNSRIDIHRIINHDGIVDDSRVSLAFYCGCFIWQQTTQSTQYQHDTDEHTYPLPAFLTLTLFDKKITTH